MLLPDSHEPQQGPTRVVDLRCGALHIRALLARFKVLSPPAICHLLGEEELAGLGHLLACSPVRMGQRIRQDWGQGTFGCPCFPAANRSCALPCPQLGLPQESEAQAASVLVISQAQDLGGAVPGAGSPRTASAQPHHGVLPRPKR